MSEWMLEIPKQYSHVLKSVEMKDHIFLQIIFLAEGHNKRTILLLA